MSTGALDGLARAPDPQRQRACCELMELLTADGAGMTADLLASLPLPPGAENGEKSGHGETPGGMSHVHICLYRFDDCPCPLIAEVTGSYLLQLSPAIRWLKRRRRPRHRRQHAGVQRAPCTVGCRAFHDDDDAAVDDKIYHGSVSSKVIPSWART